MDDATAYDITFQQRDGVLCAHVVGPEDSMEVSLAYWSDIAAECVLERATRLLVVEELGTRATRGDMEEMVQVLAETGFRNLCIAYVDVLDEDQTLALAELRARQAGLRARTFRDVDTALAWLATCDVNAEEAEAIAGDEPAGAGR